MAGPRKLRRCYCIRRVCGNAAYQPNQNARCAGRRWSTRPSSGRESVFVHGPGHAGAVLGAPVAVVPRKRHVLARVRAVRSRRIGEHHERDVLDRVVMHGIRGEESGRDRERPIGMIGEQQGEYLILVLQAGVEGRHREHHLVGREVVAVGGALVVVALVAGVERKHPGIGMAPPPLAPGGGHHAAAIEHDPLPGQRPDHRRAPHGAPHRLGGPVVHELVRAVQKAARAEGVVHPRVLGVERITVPQSVQYTPATGTPPTTSTNISCQARIRFG